MAKIFTGEAASCFPSGLGVRGTMRLSIRKELAQRGLYIEVVQLRMMKSEK
jgi:hypothetical protein